MPKVYRNAGDYEHNAVQPRTDLVFRKTLREMGEGQGMIINQIINMENESPLQDGCFLIQSSSFSAQLFLKI